MGKLGKILFSTLLLTVADPALGDPTLPATNDVASCLPQFMQAMSAPTKRPTLPLIVRSDVPEIESLRAQYVIAYGNKSTTPKAIEENLLEFIRTRDAYLNGSSTESLIQQIAQWIKVCKRDKGYLPGCSPEWTAENAQDLIADYASNSHEQSMLGNVIGNLDAVHVGNKELFLDELRKAPAPDSENLLDLQDKIKSWKENAYMLGTYSELARRINRPGQNPRASLQLKTAESHHDAPAKKPEIAPPKPSAQQRAIDFFEKHQRFPKYAEDKSTLRYLERLADDLDHVPDGFSEEFLFELKKLAGRIALHRAKGPVVERLERILEESGSLSNLKKKDSSGYNFVAKLSKDPDQWPAMSDALKESIYEFKFRTPWALRKVDSTPNGIYRRILENFENGLPLPTERSDPAAYLYILGLPDDVRDWPPKIPTELKTKFIELKNQERERPIHRLTRFYLEHGRSPTKQEDAVARRLYLKLAKENGGTWRPESQLSPQTPPSSAGSPLKGTQERALRIFRELGRLPKQSDDPKTYRYIERLAKGETRIPDGFPEDFLRALKARAEDFHVKIQSGTPIERLERQLKSNPSLKGLKVNDRGAYEYIRTLSPDPDQWKGMSDELKDAVHRLKFRTPYPGPRTAPISKAEMVRRIVDQFDKHGKLPTEKNDEAAYRFVLSLPENTRKWPREFRAGLRGKLLGLRSIASNAPLARIQDFARLNGRLPTAKEDSGAYQYYLKLAHSDPESWPNELDGTTIKLLVEYAHQLETKTANAPLPRLIEFYNEHDQLPAYWDDKNLHHYISWLPDSPNQWPKEIKGRLRRALVRKKEQLFRWRQFQPVNRLVDFYARERRLPMESEAQALWEFMKKLPDDPKQWPPLIQGNLKKEIIAFKVRAQHRSQLITETRSKQATFLHNHPAIPEIVAYFEKFDALPERRVRFDLYLYLRNLPTDPTQWPVAFTPEIRQRILNWKSDPKNTD